MYDSLVCIKDCYPSFTEGSEYKTLYPFKSLDSITVCVIDDSCHCHWLEDDGQDDFVKTHFKIKGDK